MAFESYHIFLFPEALAAFLTLSSSFPPSLSRRFVYDSPISCKYNYLKPWISVGRVSCRISHILLFWALISVPFDPQGFNMKTNFLALENSLRAKETSSTLTYLFRFLFSLQVCPVVLATLLGSFFCFFFKCVIFY